MTFGEAVTALIKIEKGPSWRRRIAVDVFGQVVDACGSWHETPLPAHQLRWGTFDNCREWGLTVSAGGWTFCAYEHRNSDLIHAEGCPDADVKEWGPYGGRDKFDTLGNVDPDDAVVMGVAISAALLHVLANPDATRESVKRAMWSATA